MSHISKLLSDHALKQAHVTHLVAPARKVMLGLLDQHFVGVLRMAL